MRLRDVGERRLISAVKRSFPARPAGVVLGIGDDAAVVRGPARLLITHDLLVEDVDFRAALFPPRLLGRKALNVNLSDIAAMGGRPRHVVLGLALPGRTGRAWLDAFLAGFREAARRAGAALVGGDFSAAARTMIAVTVTGEARRFVTRRGARPGDRVFVSGTLGDAAMGLRLLGRRGAAGRGRPSGRLLRAFLDPAPRLELGALLARRGLASAMIDLSDGLAVDLSHIAEESGAGAEVDLAAIPLSKELRRASSRPLDLALHGGEDFELLFTVRPRNLPRLRALGKRFPVTEIGRIVPGRRLLAVGPDGAKRPLAVKGYEHFR
ncbi:MAG TPA: thiamine-phosphate kinase [Terriglobales bacterium]|nr:thiamine-phosphate kinase [Terriglobales bacterium]